LTPNFLQTDEAFVRKELQTEARSIAVETNPLLAFCKEALRENLSDLEEDE
jgi:hypothetical protein